MIYGGVNALGGVTLEEAVEEESDDESLVVAHQQEVGE